MLEITTREKAIPDEHVRALEQIRKADDELMQRFKDRVFVNYDLDRTLVSFQANKTTAQHRWCKYKEGFSASLIHYIYDRTEIASGPVLDPFAGSGTTLFVSRDRGIPSVGIELLPNSTEIIEVRRTILDADATLLTRHLKRFRKEKTWSQDGPVVGFSHLRITAGAFPEKTELALGRYLYEAERKRAPLVTRVLRFAALCVLESISYTRKDGQYLRWDHRSGRRAGKTKFDKGRIYGFDEAICRKLDEIICDIGGGAPLLFDLPVDKRSPASIEVLRGSCLDILPTLPDRHFGALVTSPPYCNRYDYTRTYALELAYLGVDEDEIRRLRQTMLTCTVENKEKADLQDHYDPQVYANALRAFEEQEVLGLILKYLRSCREDGTINNTGIPRMVTNYFLESAVLIFECARLLRKGAPFVMVNDNVRYQGAVIPVDLILSDFAERAGFDVEAIWVLPRGKGNSSQQMGMHGRQEIRKCVYVWRRR